MSIPKSTIHGDIEVEKADLPSAERDIALEKLHRLVNKDLTEKDIAQRLRKRMEKTVEGNWSAIVGDSFGCQLSHIEHGFLQARVGKKEVLVYRAA
ncbi:unnamed protein product [Dibothriocephalus latus]|uniref:Dynein light chain n=1 Tax=Dibothriocephalus latus TaxID=60516 RepID=A0A3P6SWL1_DIBLA|nr:unnamed protein product [Dibothriocephalus latus]